VKAWGVLALLSVPVLHAVAQVPAPPAAGGPPPVATVGTRRIDRGEFDMRLAAAERQFESRGSGARPAEIRDVLRRQLLETMIRLNLLVLEANREGIVVTTAEAESALKRDAYFNPNGVFDANRWRMVKISEPGRFQGALAVAREQVAARRLDERVQARLQPDGADLRDKALRQLRRAYTEDLSLRTADFDGSFPEPREADVLREYRANLERFRRPNRAMLSVVFVNEPPRTQAEVSDDAAGAAWTARMKQAADSLVAAVKGGATLEDVSAAYGGPRTDVSVLPDNFPGYWRGDATLTAGIFQAKPGAVLAVPAAEGWLVVRVDQVQREQVAPLRDVAREIRARLRDELRRHHDERERRELYTQLRDSLAGPAWSFRWAAIDTGAVRVPEPGAAELDRWYRAHLADFSSFDSRTGTIVAKSFAEVKDEARARWKRDKRLETARLQANELYAAWSAGRRAGALENQLRVKETKPAPLGANVDTGFAAVALSDTVWSQGEPRGAGMVGWARGHLVWQVSGKVDRLVPSYAQVEPTLQVAIERARRETDERGARRLFEADPKRFGFGRRIHFTRLTVAHPPLETIKLTRAEVERWHRRNITKYSALELVRAKHILISPITNTAAADRAARVRADSLLARIKAGDDFDALAARFSDDPATKDKGGDLGVFARGAMLQAFEDAVFAMQAGDLSERPVKTEVGYHIIRCTEHEPAFVQPLKVVYSIVASDLARTEADTVAMRRADSLLRVVRTPAQARAAGEKLGLSSFSYTIGEDEPMDNEALVPYFDRLKKMKAGEIMPVKWIAKGQGWWITWVDSISAATSPRWESARGAAIAAYRAGAGERAMLKKTQELDSLLAAGWTLDSLGALWGGLQRSKELAPSGVREGEILPVALDSLVFGHKAGGPALAPGQVSGWVRWPGGVAKVRLLERLEPTADHVRARTNELRRIALERRLLAYFDDLKRRYPVRIRDRALAAIPLPEPPPED
jgi:parvulin-like peptidyl-prolyl isomerase